MEHTSAEAGHPATRDGRTVVFLHIGAPKSGTTYLQNVLWRNRETLKDDGVLFPGHTFAAHVHAAFDLRNAGFHGFKDPNVPGAWARIVDEARAWDGTVIISQELFSPANEAQIDRAMQALSFAEVHLVYTARDLGRQIPAAWQEDVKNRHTVGFTEFVHGLRAPAAEELGQGHRLAKGFWRMQDAVEVLARWAREIPPERVHVVTVPPPAAAPGLLWERFATVTGIDPTAYDTAGAGSNLSLGAVEASLIRRLNLALDDRVSWPMYEQHVKHYLAQEVLAGRPDPIKIALATDDHPWAVGRSKELVEGLREAGYDVVGDLEELIPPSFPPVSGPPAPTEIPPERELAAAVDAIVALLWRAGPPERRRRALNGRIEELEQELVRRRQQPIRTIVRDLSERRPVVQRARIAWWNAVERARSIRTRG